MSDDAAGTPELSSWALRRRSRAVVVLATTLMLGGGVAVAYGLSGQDPDPIAPPETIAAEEPAHSMEHPMDHGSMVMPTPTPTPVEPAPTPAPVAETPAPEAGTAATASARGTVSIPSIGVTSSLGTVSLNADGTLGVPRGAQYDKAAVFDGAPAPGQMGPAIIVGHVDGPNGPSVFYRLGEVEVGDTVEVTGRDGAVVTFVVDEVSTFPKNAFPTDRVYGNTDRPELRLITCGGEFDRSVGSHEDNVVVFAHRTG